MRARRNMSENMNNIYILSFSEKGHKMAKDVAEVTGGQAFRPRSLEGWIEPIFQTGNVLVFIGATGIAVRAIAPYIRDKTVDPAVIVMDEAGQFVIPILSGHIGGANEYAKEIAMKIGARPVLTTATDVNGVFAVDTFAVKNGYHIVNPDMIRAVSGALLEHKTVGLRTSFPVEGNLPEHIVVDAQVETGIYIGDDTGFCPFPNTLHLCPKRFHIGIGAKRNTGYEALRDFFSDTLMSQGIPVWAVARLASIDLKKDEEAIVKLSHDYHIDFITYTANALNMVGDRFQPSDFVKKVTGTGCVCEASAYLSSGQGDMILGKTKKDGMTISIAKKIWRVTFS